MFSELMSIISATVAIEGVRPLLWHHFGPDAIPLEAKPRTGKAGNDPDEWKKTVLITSDNQLYQGSARFGWAWRGVAGPGSAWSG